MAADVTYERLDGQGWSSFAAITAHDIRCYADATCTHRENLCRAVRWSTAMRLP